MLGKEGAAALLRKAYTEGTVDPLRDYLADTDIDGAYEVQSINTKFWLNAGRRIVGRKIGLTSVVVQKQLGVDQPDFGVLFDDTQIYDGDVLPPGALLQGKAEAEIALVLAHDLDNKNATYFDVLAASAYALPAIEIVDSRITDWKITIADTVADNASAAYFVLGREPKSLSGLDLRTCGMALEIDGVVASLGAGVACLGHPLNAAAWLARTLAQRGDPLRAGDIVLTGALGPMVSIKAGNRVTASIGGLGTVSFSVGTETSTDAQ